jgi:hypothetical protein
MASLIDCFTTYTDDDFEDSKLTFSYNPMMTIALTAEILQRIGRLRRRFFDQAMGMVDSLLLLGSYFNQKID